MSFTTFTQHWEDVFCLTANRLTYEVPSKTNIGSLEKALLDFPITAQNRTTHPLVTKGTTVAEKHAAIVACQRSLAQQCLAAGIPERAPTQAACTQQLMLCVEEQTYANCKEIISHDAIDTQHMTYAQAHAIALKAEKCHALYPPLFFICDAIRHPDKPKTPENLNDDKIPKSDNAVQLEQEPANDSDSNEYDESDDSNDNISDDSNESNDSTDEQLAPSSEIPKLSSHHVAFNYSYTGRTSLANPGMKMMNSFYSRIEPVCQPPVPVISTPIAVATSPTLIARILSSDFLINGLSIPPSTWFIPRYRWILLILTLIIAWVASPCVAPASPSPELACHMMSHLHAYPAEVIATTHPHATVFGPVSVVDPGVLPHVGFPSLGLPKDVNSMDSLWKPCGALLASSNVATSPTLEARTNLSVASPISLLVTDFSHGAEASTNLSVASSISSISSWSNPVSMPMWSLHHGPCQSPCQCGDFMILGPCQSPCQCGDFIVVHASPHANVETSSRFMPVSMPTWSPGDLILVHASLHANVEISLCFIPAKKHAEAPAKKHARATRAQDNFAFSH